MMPLQNFSGVVRQRLPEIEHKLEIGFSLEFLLQEFIAEGHKTTLKNFRNSLYRARRRRRELNSREMARPHPGDSQLNSGSAGVYLNTYQRSEPPQMSPLTHTRGFEWRGSRVVSDDELF